MAEANKGRANKGRCAGKLALVTGAAQGLGRAHATRLAEEGARVLCTDRNGEGAEETARLINEEFGEGTAFACAHDVTEPDDWTKAVDMARDKLGGLNVLVNNAGIGVGGNIETCDFDDWKRCFSVSPPAILRNCVSKGIQPRITWPNSKRISTALWHRFSPSTPLLTP